MNASARGMTLKTFSKTWLPLILIFILLVLVITAKGINTQGEYRDYEPESPGRSGTKAVIEAVSYTHLTLPTIAAECRSRWSPYH